MLPPFLDVNRSSQTQISGGILIEHYQHSILVDPTVKSASGMPVSDGAVAGHYEASGSDFQNRVGNRDPDRSVSDDLLTGPWARPVAAYAGVATVSLACTVRMSYPDCHRWLLVATCGNIAVISKSR